MEKFETGGNAFPGPNFTEGGMPNGHNMGMTLRDWFAGHALAAMVTKAPFFDRDGEHGKAVDLAQFKADMAISAYFYADAMIAEREVRR